jgi:hypothetical protein
MLSLLQSLTQCWEVIISDYGVITTVAAFATLAALVFLMFVVLRTLSPRGLKRTTTPPEKKKKKRKGHVRNRGGGGGAARRISTPSTPTSSGNGNKPPSCETKPLSTPSTPSKVPLDNAPDLTPLTPISSAPTTTIDPCPSSVAKYLLPAASVLKDASKPLLPRTPSKVTSEQRIRVTSVSTLDTTAMSDDLSCGSTSIRSVPSVSVASYKSNAGVDQEALGPLLSASKPKPSNPRRQHKRGGGAKKMNSPKAADGPSRWDALKPNQNYHATHHHHPGHHPHFDPHHHPKPNNRRGGRGVGGAGPKKGRNNHLPSSDTYFSHVAPNTRTSSPKPSRSAARDPVSPPALVNKTRTSPVPSSLPPPPPGLGFLPVGPPGLEENNRHSTMKPAPESTLLLPIMQENSASPSRWALPSQHDTTPTTFVSSSLLSSEPKQDWNEPTAFASSPARFGTTSRCPNSRAGSIPFGTTVKENPFAPDINERDDSQIEADLQELGGQMAGSILDF